MGGWVGVENEIKAISAFNKVVVEVEAELGNISVQHMIAYQTNKITPPGLII